jgi:hypothetical protein
MAIQTYSKERAWTECASIFLSGCMGSDGTAAIVLSVVQSVPSGGLLCGTTNLVAVGSYQKGLVRQGNPLVTYATLYWTGTLT